MARCPKVDLKDEEFLKELDRMVIAGLEDIGYREMVNEKFKMLNDNVERIVDPEMGQTQEVFDDILKRVKELEGEEMILSRGLRGYSDTPDIIVLDDDDDDAPEPPRRDIRVEESARQRTTQEDTLPMATPEPDPKRLPDSLGLYIGLRVLAKRRSQWNKASIIDILEQDGKRKYKVRYDLNRGKSKVTANHLAILDTPQRHAPGQIGPGARIAANFKTDGIYSGIVAEAPDRKKNRNRFLVFFDDGYAMYCPVNTVYLVYGPPANVWEDIAFKPTAEYVRVYLSTSERPMLSLKSNQVLKVEFQGEWHKAKCVKVDCSLVEMMYLSDGSREWIFRGSLRLEPLFRQSQQKTKATQNKPQKKLARAHTGVRKAHIEYATIDLTRDSSPSPTNSPTRMDQTQDMEERKKNVGKKSTGGVPKSQPYLQGTSMQHDGARSKAPAAWAAPWDPSNRAYAAYRAHESNAPVTHLPQSFSEFKGGVDVASSLLSKMEESDSLWGRRAENLAGSSGGFHNDTRPVQRSEADRRKVAFSHRPPESFRPVPRQSARYRNHTCSQKCVEQMKVSSTERESFIGINPLMKPLLLGWTREVARRRPGSKGPAFHIYYRTPCGRMCRNMHDVDRFMLETKLTDLDYDQFCFDVTVRSHSNIEVRSRDAKFFMSDYAGGKESIPIPCVNEINAEEPPKMPYTKCRIPGVGVLIEKSKQFMVCCDCTDNCRDRSKCPCQQLTIDATSCCKGGKKKPAAGYNYKHLYNFLPTGIYECNPWCQCNSQCLNKVVQKGIQCRLQMFRTHKKGWGIRCLDDIAKGTFVCVYTGKIQSEEQANKDGLANGDEYLAELDHIEVAERLKYEEDGGSSTGLGSDMDDDEDDDDDNNNVKAENVNDGARNDDSGNNTTDSEVENEEDSTKHMTVTLKRYSDSEWAIKSKGQVSMEDKLAGGNGDSKKDVRQRNRLRGLEKECRDFDAEIAAAFQSKLAPPRRNDDDDDRDDEGEETTDTDSDYSNNENSRSPTSGPSSKGNDRRSSQGLHSSQLSPDGKLSSDDGNNVSQTRKYFGRSGTFVIDAKQTGNLGRYLNHSCAPNLLVQNVFIDTHDLRFPWVAFFAATTIRAGTELTWDYNYEVGAVEGREIQCYCGATKCRKRLL